MHVSVWIMQCNLNLMTRDLGVVYGLHVLKHAYESEFVWNAIIASNIL